MFSRTLNIPQSIFFRANFRALLGKNFGIFEASLSIIIIIIKNQLLLESKQKEQNYVLLVQSSRDYYAVMHVESYIIQINVCVKHDIKYVSSIIDNVSFCESLLNFCWPEIKMILISYRSNQNFVVANKFIKNVELVILINILMAFYILR